MFRHLDWDSGFFGFKTAAFTSGNYSFAELDKGLRLLREGNYTLVYLFADPGDDRTNKAALELGGIPVDDKVTFREELADIQAPDTGPGIERYPKGRPEPDMIHLAILSGEYSRFRTDKNFPENSFRELYSRWITNSVARKNAKEVFIYREAGRIMGMITVDIKAAVGIIGLVAVDDEAKGKGIGRELVGSAIRYCRQHHLDELQVVTQLANQQACGFYKALGFRIRSITRVYHFWFL